MILLPFQYSQDDFLLLKSSKALFREEKMALMNLRASNHSPVKVGKFISPFVLVFAAKIGGRLRASAISCRNYGILRSVRHHIRLVCFSKTRARNANSVLLFKFSPRPLVMETFQI